MSIKALDRAQDAYNLAKKRAVQEKVIVFSIPNPNVGISPAEIRFPYEGVLREVYISCGSSGSGETELVVERCSQDDFDTDPSWEEVTDGIILAAGGKSVKSEVEVPVNENDHFRLKWLRVGGATKASVELVIQLT